MWTQKGWRRLHNEELHNFYSLPNIIRRMKSRRVGWAEHVVHMGGRLIHKGFWWQSLKERDP